MSSTCYQYIVPDLLAIWPWKRLCNPMLDEVKDESNAWVESLDLFKPDQLQTFYGFNLNLLGALLGPQVNKEYLRATCDLMHLFFAIDEYTDVANKTAEAGKIANNVMDAFGRSREAASIEPSQSKLSVMAYQFLQRTLNVVGDDTLSLERFISDFDSYIKAIMLEAEDRATGHLRPINEYIVLRRDTSAAKAIFSYLGLGLNIPNAVFDNPIMISLIENGTDLIARINDIHSYDFERSRGLDGHNIVTVVMEEYHLDLQQTLYWLSGYISRTISNFLSNRCGLPSWGEKIDKAVSVYIDLVGMCVRGSDAWSYETKRYYGEDGLNLQVCRKTTFQRLRASDCEFVTREQFELEAVGA